MNKRGLILFVFIGIIIFGFASASYDYKDRNNSIEKNYFGGEEIRGFVNMSFNNEPYNSSFTSNFNGDITLLNLLKESGFDENVDYNCSIRNCVDSFKKMESVTTASIVGKNIFGFELTGRINREESPIEVEFNLASSAGPSCFKQITLDITGQEDYIIQSNTTTGQVCDSTKSYGCFDSSKSTQEVELRTDDRYHCEDIELGSAPGYYVGAELRNSTKGVGKILMHIYKGNDKVGSCELPNMSVGIEELGCKINYPSSGGNFSVCIDLNSWSGLQTPNYKIKIETSSPRCGSIDIDGEKNIDFKIFAAGLQYGSANFTIDENYFSIISPDQTLGDYVYDYIVEHYNEDANCDPYCLIPLEIDGMLNQNIVFSDVNVRYAFGDGLITSTNSIYRLEKDISKIKTKGYLNLDISKANFLIPLLSTETKFILYLNSDKILEKRVNITKGFDFDVNPKFVSFGKQTEFIASITNVSSKWDFGDGSAVVESANNRARHAYMQEGEFEVKVELRKSTGQISRKTFTIIVGDVKNAINITITKYENRIANFSLMIGNYSTIIKNALIAEVNISELNQTLRRIKQNYSAALADPDTDNQTFIDLFDELNELNVPSGFSTVKKGILPLSSGFSNINTEYIEEISNKSGGDKLAQEIGGWMFENYESDVEFETISIKKDSGSEPILTRFKIKLIQKKDSTDSVYLIIDYPKDATNFASNYNEKEVGGGSGTYIEFTGSKEVEFILDGDVNVEELAGYVSPPVSKLSSGGPPCVYGDPDCPIPPNPRWPWVWWMIPVLIVAIFIIYMIIQEWYKKYYESYLFKNRDDLYNILTFIHNARLSNLDDNEIKKKLSAAKWGGEQMNYAFKRIDGRRTGMFEIPLFRAREQRKIAQEIAKRQHKVY